MPEAKKDRCRKTFGANLALSTEPKRPPGASAPADKKPQKDGFKEKKRKEKKRKEKKRKEKKRKEKKRKTGVTNIFIFQQHFPVQLPCYDF